MATENLIYIAFNDTQVNLITRLELGEFGFATDTKAIVYKDAAGIITTFINPSTAGTIVNGGSVLPTADITEGSLFNLTSGENPGLYRFTEVSTNTFDWVITTPIANATNNNGRLTIADKVKLDGLQTTINTSINTIVPQITDTTGGRLKDVDAIKFASIDSDADKNVVTGVNTGNGLELSGSGLLSVSKFNISLVEAFDTVDLRNSNSTIVWVKGDIAVITIDDRTPSENGSYIYSADDQSVGTVFDSALSYSTGDVVSFNDAGTISHYVASTDILSGQGNPDVNSDWVLRVTADTDWTPLVSPTDTVARIRQGDTGTFESGDVTIPTSGSGTLGLLTGADFDRIQANETALTDAPLKLRVEGFIPEITSTIGGRLSNDNAVKFDGIASGAEVNVQSDLSESDTTSDAYVKGRDVLTFTKTLINTETVAPLRSNGNTVIEIGTLRSVLGNNSFINLRFTGDTTNLSKLIVDTFLSVGETLRFANDQDLVVQSITTADGNNNSVAIITLTGAFTSIPGVNTSIDTVVEGVTPNVSFRAGDLVFFKTDFYGCYVAYITSGSEVELPTDNFKKLNS